MYLKSAAYVHHPFTISAYTDSLKGNEHEYGYRNF